MRLICAVALSLAGMIARAEKIEGVLVTSGNAEQQFVISEVKEILFGDTGMTVMTKDETTVEFAGNWQIRFCEVEATGIAFGELAGNAAKAQLFNIEGKLMKEMHWPDVRIDDLPKGIYIIRCNGRSLKVGI